MKSDNIPYNLMKFVDKLLPSLDEKLDFNIIHWLLGLSEGSIITVGNYINYKLYKLGNVYQLLLVYAELVI